MCKLFVVFGTRPEAIKMCPLVRKLKEDENFDVKVCVSGQHAEMLDQVLDLFNITPDYNLHIMKPEQTLFDITTGLLEQIRAILLAEKPDIVFVHGDTTTAFVTALSCFYLNIKIAHIEAGLRSYDIHSPYPEEFNRRAISLITDLHFAPTEDAKEKLNKEGINQDVHVTGNTSIDALNYTIKKDYSGEYMDWIGQDEFVLLTLHRRENFGEPMLRIVKAIKKIADEYLAVKFIFPMHPNPIVRSAVQPVLSACKNVYLTEPLDVYHFHNLLDRASFILTDSGGIQEEATFLGLPTLVARNNSERPEALSIGSTKLVGDNEDLIISEMSALLEQQSAIKNRIRSTIYGSGNACDMITAKLKTFLELV